MISPSSRRPLISALTNLIEKEMNLEARVIELPYPTASEPPKKIPLSIKTTLQKTDPTKDAVLVFSAEGFRSYYHLSEEISSFKGLSNGTPCISFHDLLSNEALTKLANVDLFEIKIYTDKLLNILKPAKKVRLQTPLGTDISITPRSWDITPIAPRFNGKAGYFPAGQVFTAPEEQQSNGRLVIDRLISEFMIDWKEKISFPQLTESIELEILDGQIVNITGGKEADYLVDNCLSRVSEGGKTLCELTFGTNPISLENSSIAAEDCSRETFHVGFGENHHLGGKNSANVHWDAVVEFDQQNITIL
jgi:hypothetical protein